MTDAAGTESWSYDQMGRVAADRRKTNGVTKTASYVYNLDGTLKALIYPSGRTVNYQIGAAELALSATDNGSGINYVAAATYAPQGALEAATLAGGNINWTGSYSSRLQPSAIHAEAASGTDLLDLAYDFGLGTADNGDVKAIVNNRDSTRTQYFSYDALNRIALANTQASTGANAWGQAFGYDPWGNLTNVTVTQGAAPALSVSVNSNNRISSSGYTYNAAGDALTDSVNTYTWNAEGKTETVSNALHGSETYSYDGQGQRVMKKTAAKLYWYGTDGSVLAESDLSGNILDEYIFFGGKRIARVDAHGNVNYYLADALGSSRVVTDSSGNILDDCDFLPFGDEQCIKSSSGNTYQFTGKERDAESGNDNFGARYYTNILGRFLSPDPVFISADKILDPQSLNLYAYVRNSPLNLTDSTGLDFYLSCQHTDDNAGTCQQVQNGSYEVWVQGQTIKGQFQATDVDMNDPKDASAGYHDQFGNQYTGTFDQNNGVSFTNTATGNTSGHSRFIEDSDRTDVNGSGAFTGIEGRFFDACGGSCEARASLYGSASAFAKTEGTLHKQSGFISTLDLLSEAHNPGSQWKDSSGYVHMLNPSGQMEMHFEGHPTGVDVTNFVLHMVDTVRDAASGRAAEERNRPLP